MDAADAMSVWHVDQSFDLSRCVYVCVSCTTNQLCTPRDASSTCAQKPTRVSLIYRTEPTTKKWEKTKN